MDAQKSLDRLKQGNSNFVADKADGRLQNSSRRESLIGGQSPFAVVLSCSDSRVVPEIIFDTGLGDLFVIRVAGNVANTSTVASIEFAVKELQQKLIVVVGHQNCGAVTTAFAGADNGPNLSSLMHQLKPAMQQAGKHASIDEVAMENARLTANNLISRSEIIKNAFQNRGLEIVPAFYNLDSGKVDFYSGLKK